MVNNKLISIIIPVYNIEKYLGECLDSILNQTYQNFEIILVDEKSNCQSFFSIKQIVRGQLLLLPFCRVCPLLLFPTGN